MLVIDAECASASPAAASPAAPSARGRALDSLRASALGERFYSWRASCGRLHVCSIFGIEEEGLLSSFAEAAVIGVVRDGDSRRPVCVLSAEEFGRAWGRRLRADARRLGVNEWHVRFCPGDRELVRRLARSLLS
jgi:hypothetical protein